MTARQRRILWKAKRRLLKKFPGYYYVYDDAMTDYMDDEEPLYLGQGDSYTCICAAYRGKEALIKSLTEPHYCGDGVWRDNMDVNILVHLFLNPKYGIIIKDRFGNKPYLLSVTSFENDERT